MTRAGTSSTPADMTQAEDRTHRIGQTQQVTAWYLVADETIDSEIQALLAQKQEVIDAATDGKGLDAGATSVFGDLIAKLTTKGKETK
jgi:SNF2 family DNA or RNA helicase